METDEQLIKRIQNGEKDVFRTLIVRYQTKVYAVALKVSCNTKDAEDITQEVFLQLYRSLSQFKGESTFSTWIYKIAMSKALDYKRKQNRTIQHHNEEMLVQIPNTISPEIILLEKEDKELAYGNIDNLPPPYQEVVKLYYFNELSYQEIADKLDIAVKTVESRLYRSKQIIRKNRKESTYEAYNGR
ncbi:MAG: polymerase, sigma subunit, SigW [Bacillales bacterium]|nr:polymerase, sigma subunit, SigW [Bacillales bacterium]